MTETVRREMLQAQCSEARRVLTAAGIGEGETLADGISELVSRIADIGLALADAREEATEAEKRGAVKALRIEAMRGLEAVEKAKQRPGPFRDFAVQMMQGLAHELARRADGIESGEVTL